MENIFNKTCVIFGTNKSFATKLKLFMFFTLLNIHSFIIKFLDCGVVTVDYIYARDVGR